MNAALIKGGIDKSVPHCGGRRAAIATGTTFAFVMQQPCLLCGPQTLGCASHSICAAAARAWPQKQAMNSPSRSAVRITGLCNRAGDEKVWWKASWHRSHQGPPASSGSTPASMRGGLSPSRRRRIPLLIDRQKSDALGREQPKRRPSDRLDMLNDLMRCDDLFHTAAGTAFCRYRARWPPRNLAHPQQAVFGVGCGGAITRRPATPRAGGGGSLSARSARGAGRKFDGPRGGPVHVRVAEHAGHIFLDLADEHWRAVEHRTRRMARDCMPRPVRFRRARPACCRCLCLSRAGRLNASIPSSILRPAIDFVLVVAWLLAALRSGGPLSVIGDIR